MEVIKLTKQLKLRNAKIFSLTKNKVTFIGELKGYKQKLSYNITQERYEDLKHIDINTVYNIWHENNMLRFIAQ